MRKPFLFEENDAVKTVDRLEQRFVLCPRNVKDAYLVFVVKEVNTSAHFTKEPIFSFIFVERTLRFWSLQKRAENVRRWH